jgi:hypothetical protein
MNQLFLLLSLGASVQKAEGCFLDLKKVTSRGEEKLYVTKSFGCIITSQGK